ncbi:MAG: hypothetical protein K6E10_00980 [Eubacterium sp.]|nr:hypothetical protein [Eubacterium sp.]
MYIINSQNILTPQNGLNIYVGRTEDSILLTVSRVQDPMDIGVKMDAPQNLAKTLKSRRKPGMILMGNLGDPYSEYEEEFKLTRECLKVIENYDHGVIISTKRFEITRDLDILKGISSKTKCVVEITFPAMSDARIKLIEGGQTMKLQQRLELIKLLKKEKIDVLAAFYPLVPYVNDSVYELQSMIETMAEYGVERLDLSDLRLAIPKADRNFFYQEYRKRFPQEYARYVERCRESPELLPENHKELLGNMIKLCEKYGIVADSKRIRDWKRRYENKQVGQQMSISDFLS